VIGEAITSLNTLRVYGLLEWKRCNGLFQHKTKQHLKEQLYRLFQGMEFLFLRLSAVLTNAVQFVEKTVTISVTGFTVWLS